MSYVPEVDWANGTWEGNQRVKLRIALAMTVRERLLAMEALGELSDQLAAMPRLNGPDAGSSKPGRK